MLKLSVETYSLREKEGDFRALERIREAGFPCVDFSYYWETKNSSLLGEDYREYALRLREKLDSLGLACNQAHAPLSFRYGMELSPDAEGGYRDNVRALESAAILGAKNIIVHTVGIPQDVKNVCEWEYNLRFFGGLLPYCERFGISVSVENLFRRDEKRRCFHGRLGKPEELCRFVRELNSPRFNACVDLGHAALTGMEPQDFLLGMDPSLLAALHVQDGDYLDDRHTLPLLGSFDWQAIMKTLRQLRYEGELTFEIFKYLRNMPTDFLPQALGFARQTGEYLISLYENA